MIQTISPELAMRQRLSSSRVRLTCRWAVRCGSAAAVFFLAGARLLHAQHAPDPSHSAGWLGATLHRDSAGLLVTVVNPASPAQQAGLTIGDTILRVDGILAAHDLRDTALQQRMTPGRHLTLQVRHSGVRTDTVVVGRWTAVHLPAIGTRAPQLSVLQWLNVPAGVPLAPTTTFGDGHVYVLDFTADWCQSCPGMYPVMDSLHQRYGARGLRILYVTALWDDPTDRAGQVAGLTNVQEYIDVHRLAHPVAVLASSIRIATSGYFPRNSQRTTGYSGYQVGVPRLVLIDGAGVVRAINDHETRQDTTRPENFLSDVETVMTTVPPAAP